MFRVCLMSKDLVDLFEMRSVTYNLWRQFLWVTHDEIVEFHLYTLPLCSRQSFVMRKSCHIASYLLLSTPV